MYFWNIYEISTEQSPIHGVKFRGRLRKYSLKQERALLVENASDKENVVRFALPAGEDAQDIEPFIKTLAPDATVILVEKDVRNPVLSKMRINDENRYEI